MTAVTVAVAAARARLDAAGVPGAARDAMVLLDATDVGGAEALTPAQEAAYEAAITRRTRREPVSHILGRRAFWMHDFHVTSDVLDPRPETETLVQAALGLRAEILRDPVRAASVPDVTWPPVPFTRLLDLGTGSGCILASLLAEAPSATGIGTDISEAALRVAARNLELTGAAGRATLICSDWFSSVEGVFDMIVSNPPYIPAAEMAGLAPEVTQWEPHLALTPGGDGLDAYRALTREAPQHLLPGGALLVEIGAGQGPDVLSLFEAAGFVHLQTYRDLDGRERVVSGEKPQLVGE